MLASKTFAELTIGEEASITRVVTPNDLIVFAHASGNLNPKHLPGLAGRNEPPAAPSMWVGSLFSAEFGNILPGPGTLYLSQTLRFHGRAHIGDTLKILVRVEELQPPDRVVLKTRVDRGGELLADGVAVVKAPAAHEAGGEVDLPELTIEHHLKAERLLNACRNLPPMPAAVVAPEENALPRLAPLSSFTKARQRL
jgi:phosphate butyryltransferase